MTLCNASPLGGGRCEKDTGHKGKHRKTSYPNGTDKPPFVYEWDEQSEKRQAEQYGSRFD